MRHLSAVVLLSLITVLEVNGSELGLVISDNVNVRSQPNTKSTVAMQVNHGTVVSIFSKSGKSRFDNNVLDEWYLVDAKGEKWINAMYVVKAPFYFRPVGSEINSQIWKTGRITQVDSIYEIEAIGTGSDNYNTRRTFRPTDPLFFDNRSPYSILFGEELQKTIWEILDKYRGVKIGTTPAGSDILQNPYLRYWSTDYETITSTFPSVMGIGIGTSSKILKDFLGSPYEIENDQWKYGESKEAGVVNFISFQIVDDKVQKIHYYWEK